MVKLSLDMATSGTARNASRYQVHLLPFHLPIYCSIAKEEEEEDNTMNECPSFMRVSVIHRGAAPGSSKSRSPSLLGSSSAICHIVLDGP